jgi:hypothetical protein
MFTWLSSFVMPSLELKTIECGPGKFYAMDSFSDNYTKTVVYHRAVCKLEEENLVIIDVDNTNSCLIFPLSTSLNITTYQIISKQLINGFKWNNKVKKPELQWDYLSFEFHEWLDYKRFETEFAKILHGILYPGVSPIQSSLKEMIAEEGMVYPDSMKEGFKNKKLEETPTTQSQAAKKPAITDLYKFKQEESMTSSLSPPDSVLEFPANLYSPDNVLFSSTSNLFEYLKDIENCELVHTNLTFLVIKSDKYLYSIDLLLSNRLLKRITLDSNLSYQIVPSENKLMWIERFPNNSPRCWVAILPNDISQLQSLMSRCIYENTNQTSFSDLQEKERNWIEAINLLDISSIAMNHDHEDESIWVNSLFVEEYETFIHETKQSMTRSVVYVARGSSLGVFNISYDNISQVANVPVVRTLAGEEFEARNILPYRKDTHVLVLNPYDKNKIYDIDLERETLVEEYVIDKDVQIDFLVPVSKFASKTHQPCFFALNSKGIYLIDPRLPGPFKSDKSKTYASDPHFRCAATTSDGSLVVASETGQIRLYPKSALKAKTLIKGLGDPITHIDVTSDGEWLLATTLRYLLVIHLTGASQSGFSKPISGISAKKLSISPEDMVKYSMSEIRFTSASFNTGENMRENFIITSSESFLVIFNFSSIKRNNLLDYKIKGLKEKILSCEFKHGSESSAVLTMASSIMVQGR